MKRHLAAAILAAGLSACAATNDELLDDMNFVQDQWAKSIRRLGQDLRPVYPPSEDYQVGDVYAVRFCDSETEDRRRFTAVKIGDIHEARAELQKY